MLRQINREKCLIARSEQSLALEKLKQRRADTRRKIEFGGLVIKSKLDTYDKSIILGALIFSLELMNKDSNYSKKFKSMGNEIFLKTNLK